MKVFNLFANTDKKQHALQERLEKYLEHLREDYEISVHQVPGGTIIAGPSGKIMLTIQISSSREHRSRLEGFQKAVSAYTRLNPKSAPKQALYVTATQLGPNKKKEFKWGNITILSAPIYNQLYLLIWGKIYENCINTRESLSPLSAAHNELT